MEVLATPENMRRYEVEPRTVQHGDGPITILAAQPVAYSPGTGEQYSATAGDYFMIRAAA
jgi:hypothetical protein